MKIDAIDIHNPLQVLEFQAPQMNQPVKPRDETEALIARAQAGDGAAREELILSNLRLVLKWAHKYNGSGVPFEDRVQEGVIGLNRAIDKFDFSRDSAFSTVAVWWIRQAISRAVAHDSRTIRIPAFRHEQVGMILKASGRLSKELGRQPTAEEISEVVDVEPAMIEHLLALGFTESLDREMKTDGYALFDVIADPEEDPTLEIEQRDFRADITRALERLDPRTRRMMEMHFGLGGYEEHNLKEIGEKYDLSRERVRQIVAAGIRKLRHPSVSRTLKAWL
jgi:RNA polymerase primary sigma factor